MICERKETRTESQMKLHMWAVQNRTPHETLTINFLQEGRVTVDMCGEQFCRVLMQQKGLGEGIGTPRWKSQR